MCASCDTLYREFVIADEPTQVVLRLAGRDVEIAPEPVKWTPGVSSTCRRMRALVSDMRMVEIAPVRIKAARVVPAVGN